MAECKVVEPDPEKEFAVVDIHEWDKEVTELMTTKAKEFTLEYFGVESLADLNRVQTDMIAGWIHNNDNTVYDYIGKGFRNVIREWDDYYEHD